MKFERRLWRLALGLILGPLALAGALFFYWESLVEEFVPIRVAIPASELKGGEGLAVWRLPEALQTKSWQRTPVRVYEDGKPLPRRVEDDELAAELGEGRFCVQGGELWYSALDSTNPLVNGRRYEFELYRPSHQNAIWAGVCLALAAGIFVVSLPWRKWLEKLIGLVANQETEIIAFYGGVALLMVSAFFFLRATSLLTLSRSVPIPPGALMQEPEGYFCYHLPRWIRLDQFRVAKLGLVENGSVLRQVAGRDFKRKQMEGSYAAEGDHIYFQTTDLSAPGVNGRTYRLQVLLFPDNPAKCLWGFVFGSMGLVLLGQRLRGAAQWLSWPGPILIIGLVKVWLIAGDDPIGQHADGWIYADTAQKLVWGEGGGVTSHPSGLPFVAGVVAQWGIPWRVALEVFYLGACYCMASAVRRLSGSRLAGFLLFTFVAWHPWTLSGFRDFMADPFLLVIFAALLGLLFRVLSAPVGQWKWRSFVLIGMVLFVWEWSRHEDPLLYASYGFFILLTLVGAKGQAPGVSMQISWRRLAALLLLPVVMTFALGAAVKFVNLQNSGVYAKSLINSPGLTALMKALYRVKPEKNIPFAPLTRQSLSAACEASPTLKAVAQVLLDTNAHATLIGVITTEIPGEPGPFVLWLLMESFGYDWRKSNELMLKAAEEIELALREGRLPRRSAHYPLNPDYAAWLPKLPSAFGQKLAQAMSMGPSGEPWGSYHKTIVQHTFDRAANRRAANQYPRLFLAQGAVQGAPGAIDSVAITDLQGRWRGASLAFASNFWEYGQAFDIRFSAEEESEGYRLVFLQKGKARYGSEFKLLPIAPGAWNSSMLSEQYLQPMTNIVLPGTGEALSYEYSAGIAVSAKQARRAQWEELLRDEYRPYLFFALGLGVLAMLLAPPWQRAQFSAASLWLLLAAGWLAGRASFYALLEVNSAFAAPRFMRCVSPLFIVFVILLAMMAGAILRKQISRKKDAPVLAVRS